MKIHYPLAYALFLVQLVFFAGCGSDTAPTTAPIAVASSQQCVSCHATNSVSISPVTGQRITDEWLRSPHNAANGAGCLNCHMVSHFHDNNTMDCLACHSNHHPDSCGQCHGGSTQITSCRNCHATAHTDPKICSDCHGTSNQVQTNPDVAGRCLTCHNTLGPPHFNTNTNGTTHDAQFVDLQNQGNCRNCHNPHDNTVLPEARAWATSGHGNVTAPPWTAQDFKADANCIRCHTASGYAAYVTSTPAFTPPAAPLAASPTYGVLGCNACHKNYNFTNHTSVRKIPAYTAQYNSGLNPRTFPDGGTTNLCIACHAARESGDAVLALSDASNAAFISPHNMGAAATMYQANAFINFTTLTAPVATNNEGSPFASTKSYAKCNLPDNVSVPSFGISGGNSSTHRKLGTLAIRGDSHNPTFFTPGHLDSNGPCVVCHLTAGHGLKLDETTAEKVCLNCHNDNWLLGGDGAGNALYYASQSAADLEKYRIEPQSEAFQNGLSLLKQLLQVKFMIRYDPIVAPYFFDLQKDASGQTAVTDWTRKNVAGVTDAAVAAFGSATITPIPAGGFSQIQAKRLMGACFNLHLMARDPYTFIHARTFSQRVVYDTLDYLDNNTMDFTSLTSARKLNPTIYHGTNVNVRASDGTLATESMIWISGTHFTDPGAIPGVNTLLKPMKLHP